MLILVTSYNLYARQLQSMRPVPPLFAASTAFQGVHNLRTSVCEQEEHFVKPVYSKRTRLEHIHICIGVFGYRTVMVCHSPPACNATLLCFVNVPPPRTCACLYSQAAGNGGVTVAEEPASLKARATRAINRLVADVATHCPKS